MNLLTKLLLWTCTVIAAILVVLLLLYVRS